MIRETRLPGSPRVLLTGITSIHGWPLFQALGRSLPADRLFGIRPPKMRVPNLPNVASACITDRARFIRIRDEFNPTHVVHCGGVCDLDVCEARPAWAAAMNTEGTGLISELFGESSHIFYLSTDLVFSGNTPPPDGYAEDAPCDPVSVAGRTFADAELTLARCPHHCIVRLGLPFARSITGDKGAIDWIDSRFRKGLPVTLFHDEIRSVIDGDIIVAAVILLLQHGVCGLFHCGGPIPMSLHGVGEYVLQIGGYPQNLLRSIARAEEIDGPPRVGNVTLNSGKLARLVAVIDPDLARRLEPPSD